MLRALPVLIIFMVIMIGSKVLDILKIAPDYLIIQNIKAVEHKAEEEGKAEGGKTPEAKPAKEGEAEKTAPSEGKTYYEKPPETAPLIKYSQTEIEMLQELAKRREELDNREQSIYIKENSLSVVEKNIQDKITDLQSLQEKVKVVLGEYQKKEDEKIKSLVKVYENMKPVDAAKIFEQPNMDILIEVACIMKEAKLALILSKMDSAKAKELTLDIANRRKIAGLK